MGWLGGASVLASRLKMVAVRKHLRRPARDLMGRATVHTSCALSMRSV
jgi:hypothetical protein